MKKYKPENMKRLFALIIGLWITSYGIAQTERYEFADVKPINGNQNVVFFYITGVGGDEQANAVLSELQDDNMVGDCWIIPAKDNSYRIKAFINRNVNADYIRKILLSQGVDYDVTKVGVRLITELKNESSGKKYEDGRVSEHSPVFISTGNADYDNSVYDKAKQEWIKNYPEEYNNVYGITTESKNNIEKK
ncbi:MAG: hypothetical protein HY951_03580 [Bacteroidia bacterium]|nr:hypothetical protein [Bacteroidia bacterium]